MVVARARMADDTVKTGDGTVAKRAGQT